MKNLKDIEKDIFEVNARLKHIQEDVARLQEPVPEFKVPGWYWHVERQIIFYAISQSEFYLQSNDDEYAKQNCTYPTPQEIESHLRKIAEEKYKNGSKLLSAESRAEFVYDELRSLEYDSKDDIFYNKGMAVYKQGKWAELIPDKKKLPKTKGELVDLYLKLHIAITGKCAITVSEFLNDYTD